MVRAADPNRVERKPIRSRTAGFRENHGMDLVTQLPTFVVAVLLISASPGPAMALIFRRAALRGFRPTIATVAGLETGLYVWALLAAGGFATLVAASEVAYLVLRVLGGAFLVFLGLRAWRTAWRERRTSSSIDTSETATSGPREGWWPAFAEGAIVSLANPKAAIFMMAFYPQFVPEDRPLFATTAVLALVQVMIELALYLTLAAFVGRTRDWFRRPKVRRRVEAASGTVLVGLGVKVAATSA